jgi:hypothetical protein
LGEAADLLGGVLIPDSFPREGSWDTGMISFHILLSTTAPDYDRSQWLSEKFKLGLDFPNVGGGGKEVWGRHTVLTSSPGLAEGWGSVFLLSCSIPVGCTVFL